MVEGGVQCRRREDLGILPAKSAYPTSSVGIWGLRMEHKLGQVAIATKTNFS